MLVFEFGVCLNDPHAMFDWPVRRIYYWMKMSLDFRRRKRDAAAASEPETPRSMHFSRNMR